MSEAIESPAEGISRIKQSVTHRSSALFFAQADDESDTVLTFLNHFLIKRGIASVEATLLLRDSAGTLVREMCFLVEEPRVHQVSIRHLVERGFVGSAEIVFESQENLGVPFCAATAIYRTREGSCQVHAYSRRYNDEEVGTPHAIGRGAETGWALRDDDRTESVFVLHGGPETGEGEVRLTVGNADGETRELRRDLDRSANDTRVLGLRDFGLDASFLGGREGFATIHFTTDNVFPRLLCGNRRTTADGRVVNFQATHSNFDFSVFGQPWLGAEATAWLPVPGHVEGCRSTLILYPGVTPEQKLLVRHRGGVEPVYPGWTMPFDGRDHATIDFVTEDGGGLPCRIVAGLKVEPASDRLACECSYGALTSELGKVPKRFYWGLAMADDEEGWLSGFFRPIADGRPAAAAVVNVKLYDTRGQCGAAVLGWATFERGPLRVRDYVQRRPEGPVFYTCFVNNAIAWFLCYSFDRRRGSGSMEHSF